MSTLWTKTSSKWLKCRVSSSCSNVLRLRPGWLRTFTDVSLCILGRKPCNYYGSIGVYRAEGILQKAQNQFLNEKIGQTPFTNAALWYKFDKIQRDLRPLLPSETLMGVIDFEERAQTYKFSKGKNCHKQKFETIQPWQSNNRTGMEKHGCPKLSGVSNNGQPL